MNKLKAAYKVLGSNLPPTISEVPSKIVATLSHEYRPVYTPCAVTVLRVKRKHFHHFVCGTEIEAIETEKNGGSD